MKAAVFYTCWIAALVIFSRSVSYAQHIKSIKKQSLYYNASSLRDSIDAMNNLADTLCLHKKEKGKQLALTALVLSKSLAYYAGIGDASHSLGLTHFRRNNDSALFYFTAACAAYRKEYPGYEKMAFALNNISRTYDELQQYDSSLYYAREALAFSLSGVTVPATRMKWQMYAFGAMGNALAGQTRYDSANYYYLKAVALAGELRQNTMLEVYFKALSGIQSQLGNYVQAAEYGKKAILHSRGDCRGLSISMANLAGIYSRLKDFANADKMADSSIQTGRQCNVWNSVGKNYSILGNSQMEQNNYKAALEYFKTGMQLALTHHNSRASISSLHRKMGEAYEALDSFASAKESYLAALQNAAGDIELMNTVHLSLSRLLYKTGDIDNAYRYLKQYIAFRDTVYTSEKLKVITELNTRYETEKKDQLLLLLSKEKQLQQVLLDRQLQQIAKDKAEKKEQELSLLNYQLEAGKQEQLLQIQQLDIENSRIRQKEQQLQLKNTVSRLEIERREKLASVAAIKNQRNWFVFLLFAFVVSALVVYLLFNRYRLLNKIEHQDLLLQQREHISRELHDELGATLSGIAMYTHLAREQIKSPQADAIEKSLSIIQGNAGEMVNKLNDIVWLIHPGNDSLQQLMQRLEDYAVQMAAVKNIRVKSNINEQFTGINLSAETRRNIYLLFKEAINNAVKYSNAGSIELIATSTKQSIEISVKDNGVGFDEEKVKEGNGLANMRQRANVIGADFTLLSRENIGTFIGMVIKIP